MDQGVKVFAAAPGVVTSVHDGEFDRHTSWVTPSPTANYVVIDHGNNYVSFYAHLIDEEEDWLAGAPQSTVA